MDTTRWLTQLAQASLLGLLALCEASAEHKPHSVQTIDLDVGWEYRWGDSPFPDATPTWTTESDDAAWRPIDFPSNPPDRQGRTNAWFRVELPDARELGYALFIYSIDLIAEVYLEGEQIYHYGHFDASGSGHFEGWPWHLIHLPDDYPGKTIYFRVFSDYPDIGLWGQVKIGSESSHIQAIIQRDIFPFAVGLALLAAAFGCLCYGIWLRSASALLLALLFLNLGLIPILESHLKQLVVFAPLAWQYMAAANYFLVPVSLAAVAHFLTGRGVLRIHQIAWILHLFYLCGALLLAGLGFLNLSSTYIYFDVITLISLLSVAMSMTWIARRGTLEQRFFAMGCWAVYLVLLYNGLTAHGFLPWAYRSEYLGPLLLLGGFITILLHRYVHLKFELRDRTRELEELNHTLEARIRDRTRDLIESNRTKDRFFAIIGHDLRGPIGTLACLLDDHSRHTEDLPAELLPPIRDSLIEVHGLMENLLLWASRQEGRLLPNKHNVFLRPLVEKAVHQLQGIAGHKGVSMSFAVNPECRVFADPEMLSTVLRNLLANAIKFSPAGNAVRMEAIQVGVKIRVSCIDEGVGMTEKQLWLFTACNDSIDALPGSQVETGTGLGLVLCREFLALHASELVAESAPQKGTTIRFDLPIAVDET